MGLGVMEEGGHSSCGLYLSLGELPLKPKPVVACSSNLMALLRREIINERTGKKTVYSWLCGVCMNFAIIFLGFFMGETEFLINVIFHPGCSTAFCNTYLAEVEWLLFSKEK